MLEERPHTITELKARLAERWPKHDSNALGYSVQLLLPLVHIPPRGTWGMGGAVPAVLAESYLEGALSSDRSPDADDPALSRRVRARIRRRRAGMVGLKGCAPPSRRCVRSCASFATSRAGSCSIFPTRRSRSGRARAAALPPRVRQHHPRPRRPHAHAHDAEAPQAIWTKNGLLATALVDGRVAATWKITRDRRARRWRSTR